MQLLAGAVPVFSHESVDADSGKSRVLVAVAWSPATKRVAESIGRGEYNAKALNPDGKKGAVAKSQIPVNERLLGTFGPRMYLDESGEHYILVFAQAEARRSVSHAEQAIKSAQDAAELRTKGMIARVVAEFIEVREREDGGEEAAEFSDQSHWRKTFRERNLSISARTKEISLRGLRPVKIWKTSHPATDQIVVGAIVKWSPASARQADEIRRLISQEKEPKEQKITGKSSEETEKKHNDYNSDPVKIDLDAY